MNNCRYCKEILERSKTGWLVCKCDKAQKEWEICIEIQHHKKILQELSKRLFELKDLPTKTSTEEKDV